MDAETRQVLVRAKGLLARGWCQGTAHDGDRRCLIAALHDGNGGHLHAGAYNVLFDQAGSLAEWNDYPERTQAEMVALFDRVLANDPAPAQDPVVAAIDADLDEALARSEQRTRQLAGASA